MEGIIWDRAFFALVFFVHALIGYGARGFRTHISAKTLNVVFGIDFTVLLVVAIYSCCTTPVYSGWFLAIVGYLLVFTVVYSCKLMLSHYVIVPEKEYIMYVEFKAVRKATKKEVLLGYVKEGNCEVEVALYDDDCYKACSADNNEFKVKLMKFTSNLNELVVVEKV